jgi:hypothetical protein
VSIVKKVSGFSSEKMTTRSSRTTTPEYRSITILKIAANRGRLDVGAGSWASETTFFVV